MIRAAPAPAPEEPRRVRVWFGEHVIADYKADAPTATRYAAAMSRRFVGVRITNEALPSTADVPQLPLPGYLLWTVPPK